MVFPYFSTLRFQLAPPKFGGSHDHLAVPTLVSSLFFPLLIFVPSRSPPARNTCGPSLSKKHWRMKRRFAIGSFKAHESESRNIPSTGYTRSARKKSPTPPFPRPPHSQMLDHFKPSNTPFVLSNTLPTHLGPCTFNRRPFSLTSNRLVPTCLKTHHPNTPSHRPSSSIRGKYVRPRCIFFSLFFDVRCVLRAH